ncbi:hypothetical protein [Nonomuraea fuscirosea]|uniref:hypothetical protein n=1 Tax=Nonomuraea fuscirosea TaxID=1291556 RepID=UPI00342A0F12
MNEERRTVFTLLRGRRPVAELVVVDDDFPRTYCEIRALPGFEEVRPILEKAWEMVGSQETIRPLLHILRARLLRLRLRPSYGGPLIKKVMLILDGDRATLRYSYGRLGAWRLRRWRKHVDRE